ncbi:MAG: hypothetical protein ACTSXL_04955 [Alphaproteobacteria bacterium]
MNKFFLVLRFIAILGGIFFVEGASAQVKGSDTIIAVGAHEVLLQKFYCHYKSGLIYSADKKVWEAKGVGKSDLLSYDMIIIAKEKSFAIIARESGECICSKKGDRAPTWQDLNLTKAVKLNWIFTGVNGKNSIWECIIP